MIKVINEGYKEDRARWDEILKSVTGSSAISDTYQDYGLGYRMIDITPNRESIDKVIASIKSKGFKEVDSRSAIEASRDDSYNVFTHEADGTRTVIAVIYNLHPSQNFAYVQCGYEGVEDAEYFE